MRPARRWGLALLSVALVAGCASVPFSNHSGADLDGWVNDVLLPQATEQLQRHPRFHGEPVQVVTMHGMDPAPSSNGLTAELRSRLVDHLLQAGGVTLVGQTQQSRTNCAPKAVPHYYLGIEAKSTQSGRHRVSVRALDLAEGSWVPGFGATWEGRLTAEWSRALAATHLDPFLRGSRAQPYRSAEIDLMAAQVARDLACLLRSRGYTDLSLQLLAEPGEGRLLQQLLPAIEHNLARESGIKLAEDGRSLRLSGTLTPVHGQLQQFWASLRGLDEHSGIGALSATAYLELGAPAGVPAPHKADAAPPRGAPLLSPIRAVVPDYCESGTPWRGQERLLGDGESINEGGCFGLEVDVSHASDLFLLRHRVDGALVRLQPGACGNPSGASAIAAGRETRVAFPVPAKASGPVFGWQASGGTESFYALAVAQPGTSRTVRQLLAELPDACAGAASRKQAKYSLDDWLARLEKVLQRHERAVSWRAVRVRHAGTIGASAGGDRR